MQDRFKFRAWNKLSNEMKDVISLNINYEFSDCSNVILETNTFDNIKTHNNPITCTNGLNNVVLMQCTGLKDENGKLIYEGDIVKIFHVSGTMQGKLFTDVVEWNELRCRFDTENYGVFDEDDTYEVIGNIYENPELLED